MRAAKNFQWGGKADEPRRGFKVGDEIPKKVAEDLDDSFFLEKLKKKDLTREQLLILAGKDVTEEDVTEEVDEKEFREGMQAIRTKGELASWAKEMLGIEVDENLTREDMEDSIVSQYLEEEVVAEEDDDDEDDE